MQLKTPYLIFKPDVLKRNYLEFEKLCEKYIKKYVIAYSVKTNSFKEVINKLNELGCNFEVASYDEIMKVSDLSNKSFVFNGPCKTEEELELSIQKKFLINIDSKSEIELISKILNSKKFNVGLRISLSESKFGFDERNIESIIDFCKEKNLNIICLHFHFGTQKNLKYYEDNLKKAEVIISRIKNKIDLKYVDIGGGFPDKFQLKNLGVELEDYFKLINRLNKINLQIILEPGRFLVADAFDLITKVCVIKENFNNKYAILDAGINILSKITLANYKFNKVESIGNTYKIRRDEINQASESSSVLLLDTKNKKSFSKENPNLSNIRESSYEYILAGPLLFNNDIIGKYNGLLNEGDLIKVENVGAYCYNLAWEISYKKPEIFIEK